MNRLSFAPAWCVVKKKLKEHYRHLTDAHLAEVECAENEWLDRLVRHTGGSHFQIALLAEEAMEQEEFSVVCPPFKRET